MPELTPKLGIKKPLGNETVSRAAFNENYDIIDAQVQKNIAQGAAAPASPAEGDLWIDTSTSPNALKRYTAGNWVKIGAVSPADIGAVANAGNAPSIQAGLDASKPAAGTAGRLYVTTDTQIIYRDTGSAWAKVGVVKWGDIDGKPASFTPSAHKTTHATGGADALAPGDIGAASAVDLTAHLADKVHIGNNPACKVYHNVNQSVASGTETTLAFNSEFFDTDNMHDVAVNNSRLVCNTPGKYLIFGFVIYGNESQTGHRTLTIMKSGTSNLVQTSVNAVSTGGWNTHISIATVAALNTGDYIELCTYQNSGVTLTIPYFTTIESPSFGMVRVG